MNRAAVWIIPLAAFLLIMLGYPIVVGIIYSLSDVDFQSLRSPSLIGFANYRNVLVSPAFRESFGFSLKFALTAAILEVGIALGLALSLEPILRNRKGLLVFLLLPLMVAPVLMGIMYRLLLNDFVGLIPQYFRMFGMNVSLLNPPYIYVTVIAIEVLQWTPFAFLIIFAALLAVPDILIEAAEIDGASRFQRLSKIVLPLLVPSLGIASFIRFVDSFRVFDHIYVLTGGGPGRQTTSLSIFIYRAFFQREQIGEAVAAAMLLLAVSLIPLAISMRRILREHRL